jgi:hypothetical protein
MQKLIVLFSILFLINANPQGIVIKSLQVYTSDNSVSIPVVDETNRLVIEFDVKSPAYPELNIVFRFCNRDWIPLDNAFFLNQGKNIAYYTDFERLPLTVEDADYHFRGEFPDENGYVDFPYSGKWQFKIVSANDTSIVFASGRFYVVYQQLKMSVTLKNEELEDETFFPSDLAKVFSITSGFNLPDELFPFNVDFLEIVENKKTDYPYIIDRKFNTNRRQFYWNADRKFTFTARDIRPGNEYRVADFRNTNKFISKDINAQFDGLEYSRFFEKGKHDLNGGFLLTEFNDEFATYLDVKFSFRPPEDFSGRIFITGSFNDWKVQPEFELENIYGIYQKIIKLKRGRYDYQYVAADNIKDELKNIDWFIFEGNNWETTNEYNIFLFYKDQNFGGYDRIISHFKLIKK